MRRCVAENAGQKVCFLLRWPRPVQRHGETRASQVKPENTENATLSLAECLTMWDLKWPDTRACSFGVSGHFVMPVQVARVRVMCSEEPVAHTSTWTHCATLTREAFEVYAPASAERPLRPLDDPNLKRFTR